MFLTNSCAICSDTITDPVCRNCYIKQTRVLLNDLQVNPRINNFIFDKVKDKFPVENLNNTECILCKRENVTLCGYCFSILLTKILRELNFTEDLIENFEYTSLESLEDESIFENQMEVK